MLKSEDVLKVIMKMLVEYNFQFPLSWVFIGVNGSFWTGRFEFGGIGTKFKYIPLSGEEQELKPPINGMVIDSRGDAMHFSVKGSGEVSDPTLLRLTKPLAIAPLNWPKARS